MVYAPFAEIFIKILSILLAITSFFKLDLCLGQVLRNHDVSISLPLRKVFAIDLYIYLSFNQLGSVCFVESFIRQVFAISTDLRLNQVNALKLV